MIGQEKAPALILHMVGLEKAPALIPHMVGLEKADPLNSAHSGKFHHVSHAVFFPYEQEHSWMQAGAFG